MQMSDAEAVRTLMSYWVMQAATERLIARDEARVHRRAGRPSIAGAEYEPGDAAREYAADVLTFVGDGFEVSLDTSFKIGFDLGARIAAGVLADPVRNPLGSIHAALAIAQDEIDDDLRLKRCYRPKNTHESEAR